MKIDKIFLDLDGCVADFYIRYVNLFHTKPKNDEEFGNNFDTFIEDKNFETLDLMPDAEELLSFLKTTNIPIEMLGSTGRKHRFDEVSKQKIFWLKKHNINYPTNFVSGKHLKYKFAEPSYLLIDDTDSNITDWKKAGGIAILHISAKQTIHELTRLL